MKAQILKIAGVKSEKEFYKKYPSEEAFMKVHGKAFKKAQIGTYIGGTAVVNPKMVDYRTEYDKIDKMITGSTEAERRAAIEKAKDSKNSNNGGGMDMSGMMSMFSSIGGGMSGGSARYGKHVPKAQWGTDTNGNNIPDYLENIQPQMGPTQNFSAQSIPPLYSPNAQQTGQNYFQSSNAFATPNYGQQFINNANQTTAGMTGIPQALPSNIGYTPPQASGGGEGGGTFDFAKGIPVIGGIIGGIQGLEKEAEARRAAKQAKKVSDVTLAASATRPEETKRRYVTPWDNPIQPGQMFPVYGKGTNPLAKDGIKLQGGGEIQNTYAPDYLYDNLEYEPLDDSNVKQYYNGGDIPRAQYGIASAGGAGFGENPYGGMVSGVMGNNNAGSQLGGSIGSIFGPVGGAVGSAIGGILDTNQDDIDRYNRGTKSNIEGMTINNSIPGIHSPYKSHLKDGGYMNPEYNPQVITMFGDHTAEDFDDYAHKYRAGGHLKSYTSPSERAMETYAMGGQLKTHWGGGAETLSHNPYMPGSGETVLFRGQSHNESDKKGNTGIGITYGDNPVEVERGEPMFEMQTGGNINPETGEPENTGVVFGNMPIDKKVASQLNDPELMEIANKYHGKKFKNIGIELAKQEDKQNKIISKNSDLIDSFKVETSLDKARLAGLQAMLEGADAKLKSIANTKITLANYQNAINDSKDELSEIIGSNISAEDLAKGIVKLDKDPVTMNAKWGGNIVKKAQNGTTTKSYPNDAAAKADGFTWTGEYKSDGKTKIYQKTIKTKSNSDSESKTAAAMDTIPAQKYNKETGFAGGVTKEKFEEFKKRFPDYPGIEKLNPKDPASLNDFKTWFNARAEKMGSKARILDDPKTKNNPQGLPIFGEQYLSSTLNESKKSTPSETQEVVRAIVEAPGEQSQEEEKSKTPWWALAANTLLPYFRPTDQEALDYEQLYPEMYALGSNQLEPVPAQGYRPDLATPYDISYQDILNANQADYNASQKMVGYNPAAQSVLNAQKYAANEKVLGEQFRANQAMQSGVYDQNRQTLNDAKLKNLAIFDKQYERQAEAKSNTKATTQAALNSIADKYAKHKLENRTLGIYENMYNYRFDKNGRAQNYNPLQIFDTEMGGNKTKNDGDIPGLEATRWDKNGNPIAWKKASDKKTDDSDLETSGGIKDKNGGYTKIKSKNGSILREFKNL